VLRSLDFPHDAEIVDDITSPTLSRRTLLGGALGGAALLPLSQRRALAAELAARALEIVRDMSMGERIAQFFFLEARGVEMTGSYLESLQKWRPGGILFVQPNIGTSAQVRSFTRAIHRSNRTIPPLISIDQEGGPVTRLWDDPVPGAVQLGMMRDRDVRRLAAKRSRLLADYGFDINFAPVADVAYDASSTMLWRSFGSDPKAVANKVVAMVKGSRDGGVIGAAKHFPGHGRTNIDSHALVPEIDLPWKQWLRTDALPFKAAVEQKVDMVMLGHLRYRRIDGRPMSISKAAVRVLREELGFQRIIVTDDLGMGALADYDPLDVVDLAVDAGVDVLLYAAPPVPWSDLIRHVKQRVDKGILARDEVNWRAQKIVELKLRHFGL
jgi:beta-N-acetylhexosaminidase